MHKFDFKYDEMKETLDLGNIPIWTGIHNRSGGSEKYPLVLRETNNEPISLDLPKGIIDGLPHGLP